jgi:hypothetical protein
VPGLIAAAILIGAAARPAAASDSGFAIWFSGQILAIDAQRGRMLVEHGPTETAGPGLEECATIGLDLRHIHRGMHIEAQADTRRRPWRLFHLRVMTAKQRGHAAARVATIV